MNRQQKLGYMVLGAVIMAVGIGLGAVVSPPLIAHRNGVFDEVVCGKLTVVNEKGIGEIVYCHRKLGPLLKPRL